jgi:hypothetical protein
MAIMKGDIASNGVSVTLTTGTLSPWVTNLTAEQKAQTQVYGYLNDGTQVVGRTIEPYQAANYSNYVSPPPFTVLGTVTDSTHFTLASIANNYPATNVTFIISAPMFDYSGTIPNTVTSPPYSGRQNYIYYNSSARPPFVTFATWSKGSYTITVSDTNGMEVGKPIQSVGGGIQAGVVITGITGNIVTLSQPTTAANIVFQRVTSTSIGSGYFGSDGGCGLDLAKLGVPGYVATIFADTFWPTYPSQPRNDGLLIHNTVAIHDGYEVPTLNADGFNTKIDFWAGGKDVACPNAFSIDLWPQSLQNFYKQVVVGYDKFIVLGGPHWRNQTGGAISRILEVTNIVNPGTPFTRTCSITKGSTTVTPASMTGIQKYQVVSGAGMPDGAYVASVGTTTITLNKPARSTNATASLSFVLNTPKDPTDWVFTEIDTPMVEGILRDSFGQFYSDPDVYWTNPDDGFTYKGDGYIYTVNVGAVHRVPYADFSTTTPFANLEVWMGQFAATWTGVNPNSFVRADGTVDANAKSGWMRRDAIEGDPTWMGALAKWQATREAQYVDPSNSFRNGAVYADDRYCVQKSDGTYVFLAIPQVTTFYGDYYTSRQNMVAYARTLSGEIVGQVDKDGKLNKTVYPFTMGFGWDNTSYFSTDNVPKPSDPNNALWRYAPYFRPELTFPGQGIDDFVVLNATHSRPGYSSLSSDVRKYWTKMTVVSGL